MEGCPRATHHIAESDAARVDADLDAKLLCHEADHQVLVDGCQPLNVCLQYLVTTRLQVLLVHHLIGDLLPCRPAHRC